MNETFRIAGIGGLGPWELGLILVIVLVIFGAGKLPSIASSVGKAVKSFKAEFSGKDENDKTKKD